MAVFETLGMNPTLVLECITVIAHVIHGDRWRLILGVMVEILERRESHAMQRRVTDLDFVDSQCIQGPRNGTDLCQKNKCSIGGERKMAGVLAMGLVVRG